MAITKKLLNKIVSDESNREDLNALEMVNPDRTRLHNYFKSGKGGGIPEADKDGLVYGRCNGGWVEVPKKGDTMTVDSAQSITGAKTFTNNAEFTKDLKVSFNKLINSDNGKSLIYYFTAVSNSIGDLTNLDTTDKANLVAAINEIVEALENYYSKTEADGKFINVHKLGAANGVAELNDEGKIPAAQLPSFVDSVVEYANKAAFPSTGSSGKIYIAHDTNKTYRWSGTAYVEVSESLALGETSSTAYAGDKGKQNADDIASLQTQIGSHTVHTDVPVGAKFTDTITEVIDNLTSSDTLKALSAKQGKALKDILDNLVVDNLTSTDGTKALSAKQGKALKEQIGNFTLGKSVPSDAVFTDTVTEVVDNLTTDSSTKALSAKQGKNLKDTIDSIVVDNLTSTDETKALSAKQGKALQDNKQEKLIAGTGITIAADGKTISADGGGNVPIRIDETTSNKTGVIIGSGNNYTSATGKHSVVENNGTDTDKNIASGDYSHAEGYRNSVSGLASHVEGGGNKVTSVYSHAEGNSNTVNGGTSHAEGASNTIETMCCHAEGADNKISGQWSHAEGQRNKITALWAHAEGIGTSITNANGAHAEGAYHTVSGQYSHTEGFNNECTNYCQHVGGLYNKKDDVVSPEVFNSTASAIIIGNGTSSAKSNCFRVTFNGSVYGLSAFNSSGADYAEYFEWEDGNKHKEDRIGHFVTLGTKGKINIADENSDVLGVISGMSSIIGNAYEDQYHDMYMKDVYGRFIYEDVEVEIETGEYEKDEQGEYKKDKKGDLIPIMKTVTEHRIKLNPDYDPSLPYIPRSKRPEWDVVGLLGQVVVIDDGTCVPGQKCSPNSRGIATSGDKYKVLKRLDENHVLIIANFLNY